jgi:hypothetical protein
MMGKCAYKVKENCVIILVLFIFIKAGNMHGEGGWCLQMVEEIQGDDVDEEWAMTML